MFIHSTRALAWRTEDFAAMLGNTHTHHRPLARLSTHILLLLLIITASLLSFSYPFLATRLTLLCYFVLTVFVFYFSTTNLSDIVWPPSSSSFILFLIASFLYPLLTNRLTPRLPSSSSSPFYSFYLCFYTAR